jgi:pimeloyl-ACP methyl ester carboxylesterase
MISTIKWINVGLRGLMELGIVIALGVWGYKTGNSAVMKILLCIVTPLVGFGLWGLVDFSGAGLMAEPLRLIQELLITGLAAIAWHSTGAQAWGWALGISSIVHHTLDNPSRALSLTEMNTAMLILLEVESIQRVTILGYSAGGGLAQAFIQAHPERVEHLSLSHCTPLSPDAAHRLDQMAGLLKLLPLSFIQALFKRRLSRYPTNSRWAEFTRNFFAEHVAGPDRATLIRFLESGAYATRDFHFEPQALQHWQGKILLLSSRDDVTTFPRLNELQARYAKAHTQVFEQGGHHTTLLFPETYHSTIIQLLENLP